MHLQQQQKNIPLRFLALKSFSNTYTVFSLRQSSAQTGRKSKYMQMCAQTHLPVTKHTTDH